MDYHYRSCNFLCFVVLKSYNSVVTLQHFNKITIMAFEMKKIHITFQKSLALDGKSSNPKSMLCWERNSRFSSHWYWFHKPSQLLRPCLISQDQFWWHGSSPILQKMISLFLKPFFSSLPLFFQESASLSSPLNVP